VLFMSNDCKQAIWHRQGLPCPTGYAAIGDVTIPHKMDKVQMLSVFYSYVPIVIMIPFLIGALLVHETRQTEHTSEMQRCSDTKSLTLCSSVWWSSSENLVGRRYSLNLGPMNRVLWVVGCHRHMLLSRLGCCL
jgi:hypothetical protein